MKRVEAAASEAAMGLAHEAFTQILEYGPQNSGDFVANTKVEVGQITPSFQKYVLPHVKANAFKVGDSPAQAYARAAASWKPGKLGQPVYIHSTAEHDDLYSWKIEKGTIKFRPENQGAGHTYERAARHTLALYKTIGKTQMDTLTKFNL